MNTLYFQSRKPLGTGLQFEKLAINCTVKPIRVGGNRVGPRNLQKPGLLALK